MSPSTIAHYKITGKLGEGGMGAVYRATDTKLNRDVAIKVLPDSFASDPDRLARFTREAQVLASLNHPNIAAIYGVEERALVLELVEGPTLAERIAQGPIPIDDALPIARQIAEALEYAHEKGIIHRDLKPANVKVTPEGRVKVLDFGLAKALSAEATAADPAASPTLTMRATVAGAIMGTAGYMSPEQAKGKPVDRRADIWAFGVVLMEMLTGRQLYSGETMSEMLASVIKDQPDIDRLPAATPAAVRRLVRRCLDKDPQRRLQAIGEARIALDEAPGEEPAAGPTTRSSRIPWLAAGALAIALAVVGGLYWKATRPPDRPLVRLSVDLGPQAEAGLRTTAVLSPDGNRLVFPVRPSGGLVQLATRRLDQPVPTLLVGTENASDPFFSPDGQWIGFSAEGKVKKMAVTGGAPVTLLDGIDARGAAWGDDGSIIANLGRVGGLFRIPDTGGAPVALQPVSERSASLRWPQILPGGKTVLYTASTTSTTYYEDASIEVLTLATGKAKVVARGAYFGRYLPSGHLVFVHQGTLYGQPFDLAALEARGTPVPLVDDIAGNSTAGAGQFDFSGNGTLVHLSGKATGVQWLLSLVDRSGNAQPLPIPPGLNHTPRFSPDGRKLLLAVGTPEAADLWLYDFDRNRLSRLTSNGKGNSYPVWAPDGKHFVHLTQDGGTYTFWWARADGGGEEQKLFESKDRLLPSSFSPDGRRLAFHQSSPETRLDLWTLPIDASDLEHPVPGKPEVFLRTPNNEAVPAFSPDGRWIAHGATDTGKIEVFVRPYPGPGGRFQISDGGGDFPVWSRDGRTLYYRAPDRRIMEVPYRVAGDSFLAEKPRPWSDIPITDAASVTDRLYDVSPDGKHMVMAVGDPQSNERKGNLHVTFLLNFFDEVERRVGGAK